MSAPALPRLRAGFDDTGSARWAMRVIQHFGLDEKHGFCLDLRLAEEGAAASRPRGIAAVARDDVDLVDADWLSIARSRRQGMAVTGVFPYGRIMGAVVAAPGAGINDLDGLRQVSLGVIQAGDKNWSVLRSYCRCRRGFDPALTTRLRTFGSRHALVAAALGGEVDAALVHWHLTPRLTAQGGRVIAEIPELVRQMGGSDAPTTFFVLAEDFVARRPEVVGGFIAAFKEAVALMGEREGPWAMLAADLPAADAAFLPDLRRRWASRISTRWDPEVVNEISALQEQLALWDDGFADGWTLLPGTLTTSFMH